jgi:hypothetical protein
MANNGIIKTLQNIMRQDAGISGDAQRIEQIEHQKSEVTKAITDLETLLASRMQYWFE